MLSSCSLSLMFQLLKLLTIDVAGKFGFCEKRQWLIPMELPTFSVTMTLGIWSGAEPSLVSKQQVLSKP